MSHRRRDPHPLLAVGHPGPAVSPSARRVRLTDGDHGIPPDGAGNNRGMADDGDRDVCSVPLETEDGEEVVICQQNAGPGNQVGGGEFKGGAYRKSPEEAAAEQAGLERTAPTERATGDAAR